MANSSMLVLPNITVPAAARCSTTVALYGAVKLSSIFDPQLVFTPWVQKMSLWAIGTPVSGCGFPAAIISSAARASARARSAVTVMKLLMSPSTASMRLR